MVDVHFAEGGVPELMNALRVQKADGETLTLEVAQHVGLDRVRAIAMQDTQGLTRGHERGRHGRCDAVPVGEQSLGASLNVLGERSPVALALQTPMKLVPSTEPRPL